MHQIMEKYLCEVSLASYEPFISIKRLVEYFEIKYIMKQINIDLVSMLCNIVDQTMKRNKKFIR